jgi:hypothetical protein
MLEERRGVEDVGYDSGEAELTWGKGEDTMGKCLNLPKQKIISGCDVEIIVLNICQSSKELFFGAHA